MTIEGGAADVGPGAADGELAPAPTNRRGRELEGSLRLGPWVTLLLWDYPRGSLAYDLALLVVALVVLLVPGAFWGDPLGVR